MCVAGNRFKMQETAVFDLHSSKNKYNLPISSVDLVNFLALADNDNSHGKTAPRVLFIGAADFRSRPLNPNTFWTPDANGNILFGIIGYKNCKTSKLYAVISRIQYKEMNLTVDL